MYDTKFLYTVQNSLCKLDHDVTLAFANLESPGDSQLLAAGTATNTLGPPRLIGSRIPVCDGPGSWANHRIVIYNRDEGFWLNLFAQQGIVYYTWGEQSDYPKELTPVPGPQPILFQAELTIARDGQIQIAGTTPIDDPSLAPHVLAIVNRLDFSVDFAGPKGGQADIPNIQPHSSVQLDNYLGRVPGTYVPECDSPDEWQTNRMIVTDSTTKGQRFFLNIYREYGNIYYSLGSSDYPVEKRPMPGGVSQYDNNSKVLILDSETHVQMRDHRGEPLTGHPSPPPASAYSCGTSVPAPESIPPRLIAGYYDASGTGYSRYWLNPQAQAAITSNGATVSQYVYVESRELPFQNNPHFLSRWMTELWDYWQYLGGPYVGLRAKWFSNIAIPETHDAMAVGIVAGSAQQVRFREQLFGGVRSFDMRYTYSVLNRDYVGSHTIPFFNSTMGDCVAALKEFLNGEGRSHEFIVLKLRYKDGSGTDDDAAIGMFNTFRKSLENAGLLDRVLPYGQDASGNPLSASQLPTATLESLNVNRNVSPPAYKNLLLSVLPDRLWGDMQGSTDNETKISAAYYWASRDVQTPGSDPFPGPGQGVGISIIGIDCNDSISVLNNSIDYPSQALSDQLASVATDCMLYNPSSEFLGAEAPAGRTLTPRNAYGSPYNYNFLSANFFEDTTFINNVIQLNIYNDRTDVYSIDSSNNFLSLAGVNQSPVLITIPPGTYYGSLQLAGELQAALTSQMPEPNWTVTFNGQFRLSAAQQTPSYILSVSPLSRMLGFPDKMNVNDPGSIIGQPILPSVHYLDTDRSLQVFARGNDGALLHAGQTVDCATWSELSSLGGNIGAGIAVERNANGLLEVFAVFEDGTLNQIRQQADGSWSAWAQIGTHFQGIPAVVLNQAGELCVFATEQDGIRYLWQNKTHGSWGSVLLGGGLGNPTAVLNSNGQVEVYAVGDGATYNRQTDTGWSGWQDLDKTQQIVGRMSVIRNIDGGVEVFACSGDHTLIRNHQTVPSVGPWSGWIALNAGISGNPTAVRNADGRLEVFASGAGGELGHMWQIGQAGEPWSAWESLGGPVTGAAAVTVNSDGRLEVFVRDRSDELWHIWQQLPGGPWSGWKLLGHTTVATTPVCPPPRTRPVRWHTARPGGPEPAAVEAPPVALKPVV